MTIQKKLGILLNAPRRYLSYGKYVYISCCGYTVYKWSSQPLVALIVMHISYTKTRLLYRVVWNCWGTGSGIWPQSHSCIFYTTSAIPATPWSLFIYYPLNCRILDSLVSFITTPHNVSPPLHIHPNKLTFPKSFHIVLYLQNVG